MCTNHLILVCALFQELVHISSRASRMYSGILTCLHTHHGIDRAAG
jgi:hypothetical protein